MLAPNPSLYYNGRASFVNPMYLKKAQFEKACLYKVPYDKDDLANIFAPNYDETLILEQESRSKLDKDLVKPYDYIHQNSLYEIFTPQTQKSLDQLYFAMKLRKKLWRKSFVKYKPNITKNIGFFPNQASIKETLLIDVSVTTIVVPPLLSATTLPPPPNPLITHLQQTPVPTPATVTSSSLQDLPNFGTLFRFDHRLKTLETDFSEFKQTNQFAEPVYSIPGIVDAYLANKMNEAVKTVVQLQSNRLKAEAQAKNKDFLNKLDNNIKKIIKNQVKEQVKAQTSLDIAANLSELEMKKMLIEKMESNKSIHRSNEQKNLYKALVEAYKSDKLILDTYEPESNSAPKEKTSKTTGKSTDGSKSQHKSAGESAHTEELMHIDKDLEKPAHQEFDIGATKEQSDKETSQHPDWQENPRESFDELTDTPFDFSAFMMNRLNVETLTPELLAGPTFELMKGTCKSLVELENFFEEVYKETTEQLNWYNPEGQQHPHDLRKPLPLIPNPRGHQVIPFDYFINNDLAYLCGGVSSRTYATSVTKTKAADYSHIKWIEELVPNAMWSQITIVEWHGYKHLDWIIVQRYDDKLYTFKEDDFKRLRLQDIKDMLLILVQGKLTNLNVEEQAYYAYSNLRGFIYQNSDKKNKLMRVDELYKFSDGTLNDVRTALNDRLKWIRMEYLPKKIWRQSDRERAKAMIQAIDKQLKSRRIIRSLENLLVGGTLRGWTWQLAKGPYDVSYDVLIIISIKVKDFQRSFRHSDTERLSRSDEVLKLKNFKKDATLKLFKSTNQERYEHVGPEVTSSQDGKVNKMAKRDYAWLMISRCSRSHSRQAKEQAQDLKSMITTSNHKLIIEVKDYELKTKITFPQNAAFQTNDIDAYDFDCDEISSAKVVLMANLSSYDSDVLSE
ncbi:hypothetical protein Tco_1371557, partial [Tanacetum coccineum]